MEDDWTVTTEEGDQLLVPAGEPPATRADGGCAWVLAVAVVISLILAGIGPFLLPLIAPAVMWRLEHARLMRDPAAVRKWQPWALLTAIGDCLISIWWACGAAGAVFLLAVIYTPGQPSAPSLRLLATFGALPLAVLVLVLFTCLLPLLLVMMSGSETRARAQGRAAAADRIRGRRRALLIALAIGWIGVIALVAALRVTAPWGMRL